MIYVVVLLLEIKEEKGEIESSTNDQSIGSVYQMTVGTENSLIMLDMDIPPMVLKASSRGRQCIW